jgi:hypothetical protein
MRRALLPGLLLILLLVAPAAEAKPRRDCATSGRTIAQTSHARVFQTRGVLYGCLRDRGRIVRLAEEGGNVSPSGGRSVNDVTLSGRWVAYVQACTSYETGNQLLVVRDLRTGKVGRRISSDGGPLCAGERQATIGPVLLTNYGGVVWVLNRRGHNADWVSTLWDWHERYPTILDSDPGVLSEPTLTGILLSWTRDGVRRQALLTLTYG